MYINTTCVTESVKQLFENKITPNVALQIEYSNSSLSERLTIPEHILDSEHFKDWMDLCSSTNVLNESNNVFIIHEDMYLETLEIISKEDILRIINIESMLLFTPKHRIQILKNIYEFWIDNPESSGIVLPEIHVSWFGNQVRALFLEKNHLPIQCMKSNHIELLDFLIERDSKETVDNSNIVFTLLYYSVTNNHLEITEHGLKIGLKVSNDLIDVAITKKNLQMFNLLIEYKVSYTKKTLKLAAECDILEIYKHFLQDKTYFKYYVICTLKNINNLEFLFFSCGKSSPSDLQHSASGLRSELIKIDGLYLLNECIQNAHSVQVITLIDRYYTMMMVNGKTLIHELLKENKYMPDAIIEKNDLELYTYLRSIGFKVSESALETALHYKTRNISPGLIKKHIRDDIELEEIENREYAEEWDI